MGEEEEEETNKEKGNKKKKMRSGKRQIRSSTTDWMKVRIPNSKRSMEDSRLVMMISRSR